RKRVAHSAAAMHRPSWQLSPTVQVLPSEQLVPSAAFGFEHCPVAGLQTPTTWHWSSAAQLTGAPLWHRPLLQVSPRVQALLSLQVVPLGTTRVEHRPV